MIKLMPILLAIVTALAMYHFSAWRTRRVLDQQSTRLRDPTLGALTERLRRQLDLPSLTVHVYEIEPVNGLAAPDGRIFITRGFLRRYEAGEVTAEELLSVVAHELGHVALGHARRRMFDFSGQNAIRVMLAMVLGRFIPFFGVMIANLLTTLLAARLSRQDEFEADAYAAALMTKAGFGTDPQVSLLQKLDRLAASPHGTPAWLMTHPKTEQRVAAIQTLQAGWTGDRAT